MTPPPRLRLPWRAASWSLVATMLLAGCADPAHRITPEDPSPEEVDDAGPPEATGPVFRASASEPPPGRDGGPYGGDGSIGLVAVYVSFELNTSRRVSGDMGGHCMRDDWTMDPASVLLRAPPQDLPERLVIREIHPDEDDVDQVGNFGTAPTSHYGSATLHAAFDRDRVLGTIAWDDDQPYFGASGIPNGNWLLATFEYPVEDPGGDFTVTETLHMRNFREVPMEADHSRWVCH